MLEIDLKQMRLNSIDNPDIRKLEKYIAAKKNDEADFLELISKFKGIESRVLKLKYIDGLSLEQVAHSLNCGSGYIQKVHADLIGAMKNKYRGELSEFVDWRLSKITQ
ncbi:hypothetical protein [Sporosarcina sp. P17b]|uniref:hypothetical protein n=1 Tax=Sporosarcina sp. P17b TaxID=2048260 RepID=UPI001179CEB1|nr:hypothetical protein [Sporosarcina sp. P17b]